VIPTLFETDSKPVDSVFSALGCRPPRPHSASKNPESFPHRWKARYPLSEGEDPLQKYGSVYPSCVAIAKTELTIARNQQLRMWIEGLEEGEVCAGSVRRTLTLEDGEILSPEATVSRIYREHIDGKGPLNDEEQRKFWPFIFGEELTRILEKGNWGVDPLLFAQDYQVTDFRTSTVFKDDKGHAQVLVAFKNFGEPTVLFVSLRLTDHGWRIGNIVNPVDGTDLLHDLGVATPP
jgi:hypothetical protein